MKNLNEIQFVPLSDFELSNINGGESIFYTLGSKAKELWCSAKEAVSDYFTNVKPSGNIYGPTGNSYPNN